MTKRMRGAARALVVVVVVAAAVSAGVVGWSVDRGGPGTDRRASRVADLATRPQLQWVLDSRRLSPDGVDRPLQFPTNMYSVGTAPGSVVDTGSVVVAAVGHPLYGRVDTNSGIVVDSATLIGVDRTTGDPTWRRPVGHVTQCSEYPNRQVLACWGTHRVVLVDVATGALIADRPTDFLVTYVWVIDGVVYTSGQTSTPTTRSFVLEAGTPSDPSAVSRQSIDVSGRIPYVAEVLPRRGVFTVTESVDGPVQYRTTVFRLGSGERVFGVDGDVRSLGRSLFRAESYTSGGVFILRADGSTAATLRGPALDATIATVKVDPTDAPAIVGSTVFDPDTGARLWQDPVLVPQSGGAVVTVGDVVVVADPVSRSLLGLDTRTGRREWTTPWRDAYWVRPGPTDGRHLVFADYVGMHSLDTATGRVLWTVRHPRGVDPRYASVSGLDGDIIRVTDRATSSWR